MSRRFGCHRRGPISTPLPSGSSARSKRGVSIAWFRLARLICANSSTSSSTITITRATIRAATTNSCSGRPRRSTRTATWSGGSASADFSAFTTERPHEGPANYLHLTGSSPWLVTGRIARPVRSRRSSNFNSYWDIPLARGCAVERKRRTRRLWLACRRAGQVSGWCMDRA